MSSNPNDQHLVLLEALLTNDAYEELYRQSPEFHATITALARSLPLVVDTAAKMALDGETERRRLYGQIMTQRFMPQDFKIPRDIL